jgi:hypothetical protein
MSPEEFGHIFKGDIGVQLDWDLFRSSDWVIELIYLRLPEDAQRIYTPWYAATDGSVREHYSRSALPQSVQAAAQNSALRSHHGVRDTAPPALATVVPAYKVSDSAVLLLDGNHRAVSAQVAGARLVLAAFTICGPVAKSVLPDLRHWL